MNLILLGPPGAGKGTQAKKISVKYKLPHISTGDIFREASGSGSDLGKKLQEYMSAGQLVPDSLVLDIVKERLNRSDCKKGFLLDGFPRTLPQAEALGKALTAGNKKIDKVLSIDLSEDEVVKRLSGRRGCGKCGANYNIFFQPPKVSDKCDKCGANLVRRADDNPDTIRQRMKVYNDQTTPLIKYYTDLKVLYKIDGKLSVEEVFGKISAIIER